MADMLRLEGIVADMLSDWKDSGRYAQIGRDSGRYAQIGRDSGPLSLNSLGRTLCNSQEVARFQATSV